MSEGPGPRLFAGRTRSRRHVCVRPRRQPAPRGERVASSSARRSTSAPQEPASAAPAQPRSARHVSAVPGQAGRQTGPLSVSQSRRTYVLDTSVLLADPAAVGRFAEHRVVLPVVVITELEAKRHHPELGFFARQALRNLDDLRVEYGRLDADLPVGDEDGTVRVELNHADPSVLPAGFRLGDNDTRILSVARSLAAEGDDVVLVSKDLPLRVKAASIGLTAQEYRAELPAESGWTGMQEISVTSDQLKELYDTGRLDCDQAADLPCHTGLVLCGASGSALGRVLPDKSVRLVRGDREAFGLRGRSAEQRVA